MMSNGALKWEGGGDQIFKLKQIVEKAREKKSVRMDFIHLE